jgi:hypothetical protein
MANPILNNAVGSGQSIYEARRIEHIDQNQSVVGEHVVGKRGQLTDGRVFYYATNGAVALTAGSSLMIAATTGLNINANDNAIVLTASYANFAAGAKENIKLLGTDIENADIIEGAYAEGYLYMEKVAPIGQMYQIRSHQSINNDDALPGEINLYSALATAASATTQISFAKNRFSRTIATSTGVGAETVIGVAPIAVAASGAVPTDAAATEALVDAYCYWAQTWGPCCVEVGSTGVAPGVMLTSDATADQLDLMATLGHGLNDTDLDGLQSPKVAMGLVSAPAAQADCVLVDLRIAP